MPKLANLLSLQVMKAQKMTIKYGCWHICLKSLVAKKNPSLKMHICFLICQAFCAKEAISKEFFQRQMMVPKCDIASF